MIFVCYSRLDDVWRRRFLTMAKPLDRYEGIKIWSDREIQAGENWRGEIAKAMSRASIAVLLVSDNFLDSEFIAEEELPYFLDAAKANKVTVLWILLAPCLWKKTRLKEMQAFCVNELEPLIGMNEFAWKKSLCGLCERIDEVLRTAEIPVINKTLDGKSLPRVNRDLQVLAEPAKQETEVLVFAGNNHWYRQAPIKAGSQVTTCCFGNEKSGKGFRVPGRGVDNR